MEKLTRMFERVISICIDSMLAILVVVVLIFMGKAIFMISTTLFPLSEAPHLSFLIEEIATLFILLEIILMLLRYMKDGHHIPVRYLILISITAILRELLLTQGMANDALFFALAIFVLVLVLLVLQKNQCLPACPRKRPLKPPRRISWFQWLFRDQLEEYQYKRWFL